jgi:hypothetical protein
LRVVVRKLEGRVPLGVLDELATAGDEFPGALGVFGGPRPDGWAHGFGKAGDDVGVQRIGLGERSGGAGEIADLPGVDERHREMGAGHVAATVAS